MGEEMKNFINAIGAISEMTLIFYRNTLNAGATMDEAIKLTQAFIAATLFGNQTGKKEPDEA